jgi:hypothetical protein
MTYGLPDRPTAAPAHFPYDHPTLAEVDAEEQLLADARMFARDDWQERKAATDMSARSDAFVAALKREASA